MKALCASALVATLAAASAPAANLVANGDFESGSLGPWAQGYDYGGAANWSVTSSDSHSGTFSATVTGNKKLFQDIAPTATSEITDFSFWANGGPRGVMQAQWIYSDGSNEYLDIALAPSTWMKFDLTSRLDADKELISVWFWGFLMDDPSQTTRSGSTT